MRSSLPSYSIRAASPSKYSSRPSRFCLKRAGFPVAIPYWNPSSSWRTTILSPRMTRVPRVRMTLPSKVAIFFTSSAFRLSDSILTGLSRSAFSASAAQARHAAETPSTTAASVLFFLRNIENTFHLGLQRELLLVLVDDHADAGQLRSALRDGHRAVGRGDALVAEHMQKFGAGLERLLHRGSLAHDQHVAVEEGFLALPVDDRAVCRRHEIAAVG